MTIKIKAFIDSSGERATETLILARVPAPGEWVRTSCGTYCVRTVVHLPRRLLPSIAAEVHLELPQPAEKPT